MIKEILNKFNIEGELINITENHSGNINKTFVATFKRKDGSERKYLIQKINTTVFAEPYKLMKNIEGVTAYLKRQMIKNGDTTHQVPEVIKTKDNKSLCYVNDETGTRKYYRIYEFIENAVSYDQSQDKEIVYNTGKAFGNFQRLLGNYPMSKLEETIKDFHDTKKRYDKLMDDIKIDSEGRVAEVANEIVFILMREDICSLIMDDLGTEEIPYRVTHNDTKLNNILFDESTDKGLCIIDLDTIMPGLAANDFGDSIRFGAATAQEDEKNLDLVHFDINLYEMYVKGYLEETKDALTDAEIKSLAWGARIITLECGIRFLTDYLQGDTYFKTSYPEHNLVRARTQFKLVYEMEQQFEEMQKIIQKYL